MTELVRENGLAARPGRAVTGSLRALLADHDDEETAEYVALVLAAADSLQRLTADDAPRRIVVAAELPDEQVRITGREPGRIQAPDLDWARVVSFHVDEDTPAARHAVDRCRAGEEDAEDALEDLDLLWFDVTERMMLV